MIKSFLKFLKSKDFKEYLTIIFFGMVIIGICIFIYKCPVKASSGDNTVYFPMSQNENNTISDNDIQGLSSYFDYENYNVFIRYAQTFTTGNAYYFVYCPKSDNSGIYAEISSNLYQFSLYGVGSPTLTNGRVIITPSGQVFNPIIYNQNAFTNFRNLDSSVYNTNVSYISNFKVLTNRTSNSSVVLKYGWELPPDFMHDTSHATPPDTYEIPVYTTGHTPPTNVPPTYTINNYSWTTYTPPTLDTSNAETLLESIYNAIVYNGQYLKDNIHGELTNLVNNIGGYFDFIGDTIQYYGNLIISNIQNGITTFYNNINSAIVGIGNAVGYITQPLDMDNLTNAVNSTHIWGDVDTCTNYANDAFGIYGTVAEPNTFKIPLDLRSISLLNITQVYYIDLSWLDGAKQAIRAFMWCVVTFGLLYSVIVDIPNMIRSSK